MQLRRIKNILQIIDGDEKLPMSLLVDSYTQLNVFQAMLKQQNLDKKKVISHWHYCNISERIEGRIMYYEHIRHKNSQDFLKYWFYFAFHIQTLNWLVGNIIIKKGRDENWTVPKVAI